MFWNHSVLHFASRPSVVLVTLLACCFGTAMADSQSLDGGLHHLRSGDTREWDTFPETAESREWEVRFDANPLTKEATLELRQQDVKQGWAVTLNGQRLGLLTRDENDMTVYFPIPEGALQETANVLAIAPVNDKGDSDDIRVGEIFLHGHDVIGTLAEWELDVRVLDAETNQPIPARITILRDGESLQQVHVEPSPQLAVRPGTVYTSTGVASIHLPKGSFQIFAGRGFEYSLDKFSITLRQGSKVRRTMTICREVPTDGWVACDTHIHTRTHSGHGDASVQERMVTIAAEGIELAIATDHNVQIDHRPFQKEVGVEPYFTPVIGNEVTTPSGHFNIFPVPEDSDVPNHQSKDWTETFERIESATSAPIIILNHARDLHSGVRPFGPDHFNDVVASSLDGWPASFNGMEVINSGATQSDPLQLFHDWMALLNRGVSVSAVGSSDSHDVARHFVGQGRTYLRCDDSNPGNIDVAAAVDSFQRGAAMVSYGLLCDMTVDGKGPGELVTPNDNQQEITVKARVLGPHWTSVEKVWLFQNGERIREERIASDRSGELPAGVKATFEWKLPVLEHDVHLVAIAMGPGIEQSYWRTAKPYQPTTIETKTNVLGCSGAVWVDCDGDNEANPVRQYAEFLVEVHKDNHAELFADLNRMDRAIAAHAADLLFRSGRTGETPWTQSDIPPVAAPHVKAGFQDYFEAWRKSLMSRQVP
ncbi:MAG: CehA/McbA family metallohydrolase [Planctomycetaceae bacterium]|nr:CehA/McbA family metallohydrolase [Planctomycetaceae bacterium]